MFLFTLNLFLLIFVTSSGHFNSKHFGIEDDSASFFFVEDIEKLAVKSGVIHQFDYYDARKMRHEDIKPEDIFLKITPPNIVIDYAIVARRYTKEITMCNISENKTITIGPVYSSKPGSMVHPINMDTKEFIIGPKAQVTLKLLFIPQRVGPESFPVIIVTSLGNIKYSVNILHVDNLYKLRSLAVSTLPFKAVVGPYIRIYNAHPYNMMVKRIFASNERLLVEKLNCNKKKVWIIPPYCYQSIARIWFVANIPGAHSYSINIALDINNDTLTIFFTTNVAKEYGLYYRDFILDFGIAGHLDLYRSLPFLVCNSHPNKSVALQKIKVDSSYDGDYSIIDNKRHEIVPAGFCTKEGVARLSLRLGNNPPNTVSDGIILLENDAALDCHIRFRAAIINGGLLFNEDDTRYITKRTDDCSLRPVRVTNKFQSVIHIYRIEMERAAINEFELLRFEPTVLNYLQQKNLFEIRTRKGISMKADRKEYFHVDVYTNISEIVSFPIKIINGMLEMIEMDVLRTGLPFSSTEDEGQAFFGLMNYNIGPVTIKSYSTNNSFVNVQLLTVLQGDINDASVSILGTAHLTPSVVPPSCYAIFKIFWNTSMQENDVYSEIWVDTDGMRTAYSWYIKHQPKRSVIQVVPDPVEFAYCFPGAICRQPLYVESISSRNLKVTSVTHMPFTNRFKFIPSSTSRIVANTLSHIGDLIWNPSTEANVGLGYLGIPNNDTARNIWLWTVQTLQDFEAFDVETLNMLQRKFETREKTSLKLAIQLDTSELKRFLFNAEIDYVWPSITDNTQLHIFQDTQVNTISFESVVLHNPLASRSLTVQAVIPHTYSQINKNSPILVTLDERIQYHAREARSTEFFLVKSLSGPYIRDVIQEGNTKWNVARDSIVFVIPPGRNTSVVIGFSPTTKETLVSHLHVRNDLNVIEVITVMGDGVDARLSVDGLEQGSTIYFLEPTNRRQCRYISGTTFTTGIQKNIRIRNSGTVPVNITRVSIDGRHCYGNGFRLLNCPTVPVVLMPNMSKRVEILFTPDFTKRAVLKRLQIETDMTSGSKINYTLHAVVSDEAIFSCSRYLYRPQFEKICYYCYFSIYLVLLLVYISMAGFEAFTKIQHFECLIKHYDDACVKIRDLRDVNSENVRTCVHTLNHNHHYTYKRGSSIKHIQVSSFPKGTGQYESSNNSSENEDCSSGDERVGCERCGSLTWCACRAYNPVSSSQINNSILKSFSTTNSSQINCNDKNNSYANGDCYQKNENNLFDGENIGSIGNRSGAISDNSQRFCNNSKRYGSIPYDAVRADIKRTNYIRESNLAAINNSMYGRMMADNYKYKSNDDNNNSCDKMYKFNTDKMRSFNDTNGSNHMNGDIRSTIIGSNSSVKNNTTNSNNYLNTNNGIRSTSNSNNIKNNRIHISNSNNSSISNVRNNRSNTSINHNDVSSSSNEHVKNSKESNTISDGYAYSSDSKQSMVGSSFIHNDVSHMLLDDNKELERDEIGKPIRKKRNQEALPCYKGKWFKKKAKKEEMNNTKNLCTKCSKLASKGKLTEEKCCSVCFERNFLRQDVPKSSKEIIRSRKDLCRSQKESEGSKYRTDTTRDVSRSHTDVNAEQSSLLQPSSHSNKKDLRKGSYFVKNSQKSKNYAPLVLQSSCDSNTCEDEVKDQDQSAHNSWPYKGKSVKNSHIRYQGKENQMTEKKDDPENTNTDKKANGVSSKKLENNKKEKLAKPSTANAEYKTEKCKPKESETTSKCNKAPLKSSCNPTTKGNNNNQIQTAEITQAPSTKEKLTVVSVLKLSSPSPTSTLLTPSSKRIKKTSTVSKCYRGKSAPVWQQFTSKSKPTNDYVNTRSNKTESNRNSERKTGSFKPPTKLDIDQTYQYGNDEFTYNSGNGQLYSQVLSPNQSSDCLKSTQSNSSPLLPIGSEMTMNTSSANNIGTNASSDYVDGSRLWNNWYTGIQEEYPSTMYNFPIVSQGSDFSSDINHPNNKAGRDQDDKGFVWANNKDVIGSEKFKKQENNEHTSTDSFTLPSLSGTNVWGPFAASPFTWSPTPDPEPVVPSFIWPSGISSPATSEKKEQKKKEPLKSLSSIWSAGDKSVWSPPTE